MIRPLSILALPVILFAFNSCKKGSGHAKPGEDAKLLQLGPPTEELVHTPDPASAVAGSSDENLRPAEIDPDFPTAILVKPNRDRPFRTDIPDNPPRAIPAQPNGLDDPDATNILPIAPLYPSLTADLIPASSISDADYNNGGKRFSDVRSRATEQLKSALLKKGFYLGDPIFIRVLKEEKQVELFFYNRTTGTYGLAMTYNIAAMSGKLGPKKKEGDLQAPEGFYYVPLRRFNPASSYHLAFNIGYPNKYDRAHSFTGSAIMMHGAQASVGCYAMTDKVIEEIYTICHAALSSGRQKYFRFHSFPFRMTAENMERHKNNSSIAFWRNLKEGYDLFEKNKVPPNVNVKNKRYSYSQ